MSYHSPIWPPAADRPPLDRHPPACTGCELCDAFAADEDADDRALLAEYARTARLCATGLALGLVVAKAIDWLTAGPGLHVMVGL